MCGIHGFTWRDRDGSIDRMVAAAAHRGPDGSGTWGDDRVTLGHNLLAVSDGVEACRQPRVTDRHAIVFNGEIYNYRELRAELTAECRTDSDTEVLMTGLVERGPDFLRELDGMFALALYDRVTGELLLARDSNGSRPVYYTFAHGHFAFSSEVRSLLELGVDRVVSREAFRHFYYSGLVAGPLTLFNGVRKLVPGEVVRYSSARGLKPLFNLNDAPPKPFDGPVHQIPEALAAGLRESVRLALGGRRKVGLFLSGGTDSASVLHEAVVGCGATPDTFTTRFTDVTQADYNSDATVARHLAKIYGTTHEEVPVGQRRWADGFAPAVVAMEEPRQGKSYSAYYATYRVAASRGTVVVLSGDGGDELLMGYKHQKLPPFSNKLAALRAGHRDLPDQSLRLSPESQTDYLEGWLPKGGLTGDPFNDFMYTECLHTLSEDFLIRNDKLGSAFGMEARHPMLCKSFRDLARSIPGSLKLSPAGVQWDASNKILLRRAYGQKLPALAVTKKKTGWRAPTNEWIVGRSSTPAPDRNPVRDMVRQVLRDRDVRALFGISESDVEDLYLNNREFTGPPKPSGKPSVGPGLAAQKELFTVMAFAVWFKAFGMRLW